MLASQYRALSIAAGSQLGSKSNALIVEVLANTRTNPMSEWRPINEWRGQTPVDLWIIPPSRQPAGLEWKAKYQQRRRVTDCTPDARNKAWMQSGNWVTGRQFYDAEGDLAFDPSDTSEEAFRATHWMQVDPPYDAHDNLCSIHDAGICNCEDKPDAD